MPTRRDTFRLLAATVGIGLTTPIQAAFAQSGADLNVSPKRVVFAPDMRSATVYVFNLGGAPASYSIGLVDRVMSADGQIRAVTDPSAQQEAATEIAKLRSAQPLVTFTPRRVILNPGQSQVVRLRVLRPPELANGEYRTHLTVTALPAEDSGLTAEQAAGDPATSVVTRINTLFSISIPLIVRQGPADVNCALENIAMTSRMDGGRRQAVLSLDLARKGGSSLFGDIEVRVAKAPKSAPPLGVVRGVGVYPEIDRRAIAIPLQLTPQSGDKLEVIFRDDDTKPGQALVVASFSAP